MSLIMFGIRVDERYPSDRDMIIHIPVVLEERVLEKLDRPSPELSPAKNYEDLILRECICTPTKTI